MIKPNEILVDGITARQMLSLKNDPAFPMGKTLFSAIKRAMGITTRRVSVAAVRKFLKDNPNFSEKQIYARRVVTSRVQPLREGSVIELRHGRWVFPFKVASLDESGKPQRLVQLEA
jgi:hypothetical protein